MRREIAAIDSQQAVMQGGSLEQLVSDARAKRRLQSTVLAAFAALAVLLAALGIYGVTAHSVTRRPRDRHTPGSGRATAGRRADDRENRIAGDNHRCSGRPGRCGGALKVLASFMFGVSALDSATFAGVALLLTLVAGLALYLPSRRAAMVDPVIVLREA